MSTSISCHVLALAPALVTAFLLSAAPVHAGPLTAQDVAEIRAAAEELQGRAAGGVTALPEGTRKILEAVVIVANGRAQWRADDKAAWKNAAMNDILRPGAMIRTGRDSRLVLRVGHNATLLVDRNSRVTLPEIAQVGSTLTTKAQVSVGRAEVKVDRVGLTNDFSVLTPSATLAVRGTGFAVQYGGLNGTQVFAARENALNSLELFYFLSLVSQQLSSAAVSTEGAGENPVISRLFDTFGPSAGLTSALGDDAMWDTFLGLLQYLPSTREREIDVNLQSFVEEIILPVFNPVEEPIVDPPDEEEFTFGDLPQDYTAGMVAEFICVNLFDIFVNYDSLLLSQPPLPGKGMFEFPGLESLYFEMSEFCGGVSTFGDDELIEIVLQVQGFCEDQFVDPTDVSLCIVDFVVAVSESFGSGR